MSERAIEVKKQQVEAITTKFQEASSVVVVEYRGLTVEEVTDLRNQLRAENVELKVLKNGLVQRATVNAGFPDLESSLTGPNAIAFGNEDAIAPARVLAKFSKDHDNLVVKAGIVEGKVVDQAELVALSKLPDREGMYSMLLSVLQAPVSQFARVVKAVADAKPEDGSAVEAKSEEVVEETVEATTEEVVEVTEEPKEETKTEE